MSNFSDMFFYLRKKAELSQDEMAEKLGCSRSTVAMYETGKRVPPLETLEAIADYFNVDMNTLTGKQSYELQNRKSTRIPVLGRIPAGIPLEAIEDVIGWEDIAPNMLQGDKQYFALQIRGDSMEPEYIDGDIIIVLKQDSAETGEDVVAMVNGSDATFKRLSKIESGIILRPINPKYDPLPFSSKEIQSLPVKVLGVCVELRRKKK